MFESHVFVFVGSFVSLILIQLLTKQVSHVLSWDGCRLCLNLMSL